MPAVNSSLRSFLRNLTWLWSGFWLSYSKHSVVDLLRCLQLLSCCITQLLLWHHPVRYLDKLVCSGPEAEKQSQITMLPALHFTVRMMFSCWYEVNFLLYVNLHVFPKQFNLSSVRKHFPSGTVECQVVLAQSSGTQWCVLESSGHGRTPCSTYPCTMIWAFCCYCGGLGRSSEISFVRHGSH